MVQRPCAPRSDACTRRIDEITDGDLRAATTYATGPPAGDVDTVLGTIRAHWEDKGSTVSDRAIGDVRGVSARDADGGSMSVLSGPGGTGFDGETPCSAVDGGPHALID